MEIDDTVSIDTNVLVRFLVKDDALQNHAAKGVFEANTVFIPESVFLETEWVLRAVYGVSQTEIYAAFSKLLRLPRVQVIDPMLLRKVLSFFNAGFDFADALHLLRSDGHEFKSFDKALLKKALESGLSASLP